MSRTSNQGSPGKQFVLCLALLLALMTPDIVKAQQSNVAGLYSTMDLDGSGMRVFIVLNNAGEYVAAVQCSASSFGRGRPFLASVNLLDRVVKFQSPTVADTFCPKGELTGTITADGLSLSGPSYSARLLRKQ